MVVTMNGIALSRMEVLTAAGIDPHGPMSQFRRVFGTDWVYCNQHLRAEKTDGGCAVDAMEKFPLTLVGGTYGDALAAARAEGFRIYGEPTTCQHCEQTIRQPQHSWVTEDNDSHCPAAAPRAYQPWHRPVSNLPANRIDTI